ncbi:MAG TPA: 3'-5' exonuclease, partial [Patescibacteria group bacterium]|nr:3'-5' exonuclease [Patescibacteria group bacterium]
KGYISKKQLNYAKTLNYDLSVFDRIGDFPGISSLYKKTLRELKLDFKKLSKLSPRQAINFIEYNLKYERYLKENSMKFGYTYDTLKTTLYYLKLIAKKSNSLNDLLNRLKYLQHLCNNSKDTKNAVTLSTVHSAKGLEFSNVYMIDLIDGDFPSISSIESSEKGKYDLIEEERRLFYVGMTRAKHHLTLMTMNSVGDKKVKASRFLLELEEKKNL